MWPFNEPNPTGLKYRIIETDGGRFFPQVFRNNPISGEPTWCYINEFCAKEGTPAWYTFYKYEVRPIELEHW